VKLDFPRRRPQTEALKKQNEQLAQKYGIQGFPTIIVLNGQGEKVGELGYMEGGPSPFLAKLETLPKS
jgi:protein disulfide-isomerase